MNGVTRRRSTAVGTPLNITVEAGKAEVRCPPSVIAALNLLTPIQRNTLPARTAPLTASCGLGKSVNKLAPIKIQA